MLILVNRPKKGMGELKKTTQKYSSSEKPTQK